MRVTAIEALERVGNRVAYNTDDVRQKNRQRRNQTVDLYGYEFTRNGDGGSPADFYISISPDMIYLQRFEFKLIVQPFISTVTGGTQSATVTVNNESLSLSGSNITPNPHKHTTNAHTHNLVNGIATVQTTATDFVITIEGVDVTPYLMAQYGEWIAGEGVYPSLDIGQNYDILEVASDLYAEGRETDAEKLVSAGYKKVQISSGSPFSVTMVMYLKYSHMSR